MSSWKESVSIASSTVVVGAITYFGVPNAAPWSTLVGGAVAATGVNAVWAKKRQQEISQPENSPDITTAKLDTIDTIEEAENAPPLSVAETLSPPQRLNVQSVHEPAEHSSTVKESVPPLPLRESDTTLEASVADAPPTSTHQETQSVEESNPPDQEMGISDLPGLDLPDIEAASTDASENEETSEASIHPVVAMLQSLNIEVQAYSEPRPSDVLFDQSALMLGDRYQDLEHCFGVFAGKYRNFDTLSRRHHRGEIPKKPNNVLFYRFEPEASSQYRTLCYDFFSLLKQNTLIRDVKWSYKDNDLLVIVFQKNLDPSVLNFINGFWLERYVYQKIRQVLVKNEQSFSYLRNIKIKAPETGAYNELDVLFLVENELLWCECTTGRQYSKNLEKYAHHLQKLLKLPPERTFLVLRSSVIDEEIALGISDKWGITVANEVNLATKLQPALN